jgi:hypothetical protein
MSEDPRRVGLGWPDERHAPASGKGASAGDDVSRETTGTAGTGLGWAAATAAGAGDEGPGT